MQSYQNNPLSPNRLQYNKLQPGSLHLKSPSFINEANRTSEQDLSHTRQPVGSGYTPMRERNEHSDLQQQQSRTEHEGHNS